MSRIPVVDCATASAEQGALLGELQQQLGAVPNVLRVVAHSPVALRAFLALRTMAGDGSLDAQTRERIALTLAVQNGCAYSIALHTIGARRAGLNGDELAHVRAGTSQDAQAAIAVGFARSLMENRGAVSTLELAEMRAAGYSDAALVEVITHVGLNFLTNVFGKTSRVQIDVPAVEVLAAG